MSKLKVTTISDPDNNNTALTVASDGKVTLAQDTTFSGNVGIGTSSPSTSLDVVRAGVRPLRIESTSETECQIHLVNTDGNVQLEAHSGNFNIDADKVGIGTTSPAYHLTVQPSSGNAQLGIRTNDTTSLAQLIFGRSDDSNRGGIYYDMTEEAMEFHSGNTGEKMRIDSSGNLLVGTTDYGVGGTTNTGIALNPNGASAISRSSNPAITLNRTTSEGDIALFRKDGTNIGTIGANGTYMYVGTGDTGLKFRDLTNEIRPFNTSSLGEVDAAINLGTGSHRFKNLYLSGGVYLGGTGSANYLDDYEEGTWTPSFIGTTTNPTITYTNQEGYYTKIGNIVHCIFNIAISAKSGGSGLLEIAGLPFTVDNTGSGDGRYAGLCGVTGYSGFGSYKVDNFQVRINTTRFRILRNDTGGIGVFYVGEISGDEYLTGGFSYRAS